MEERRQSPRFSKEANITFRLLDVDKKAFITNVVGALTVNFSDEGLCLLLPRGWECPECNNCLGWFYNACCNLRNNHTAPFHPAPAEKLPIRIYLPGDVLGTSFPIELEGECVWISQSIEPEEYAYKAGISLVTEGFDPEKPHLRSYQKALNCL